MDFRRLLPEIRWQSRLSPVPGTGCLEVFSNLSPVPGTKSPTGSSALPSPRHAIIVCMTRRDLARLAAGAAALFQRRPATAAAAQYTGALDGFENKVDMSSFDPVLYTLKAHDAAPLRLTFRATDRPRAEAWQKQLRPKIAELVGGFPAHRTALQPQTLEVRDYLGYRREKFVFESAPGVGVLGYLLTPKAGKPPFPAVVCVPGHGRGVDDIVGIDDQGQDRTVKVGYEYDYAIQVVEHGMAAVAIEPMAFGCRRDPRTKAQSLTASACLPVAGSALLLRSEE